MVVFTLRHNCTLLPALPWGSVAIGPGAVAFSPSFNLPKEAAGRPNPADLTIRRVSVFWGQDQTPPPADARASALAMRASKASSLTALRAIKRLQPMKSLM